MKKYITTINLLIAVGVVTALSLLFLPRGIAIGISIGVALVAGVLYMKVIHNFRPAWYAKPAGRALKLIEKQPDEVTPGEGIKIYYEPDVPRINLAAVDRGSISCFERLACRYAINRAQHDIKIAVVQGERAPESGDWAFRVPIIRGFDPYFDSEWDMMRGQGGSIHYVLAAGQWVCSGTPYGDVIIVPGTDDAAYIEEVVNFELEHNGYAWYDSEMFEQTKYHGQGQGHPIIPPCPGSFAAADVHSTRPCYTDGKSIIALTK